MIFATPPPSLAFIFQANLSGPPFWILPKSSVIPAFGLLVTTDFQFCSPKNQVIPLKSSLPPSQAINNDRSLIELRLRQRPRLTTLYCRRLWPSQVPGMHCKITAQQPNSPTTVVFKTIYFDILFIFSQSMLSLLLIPLVILLYLTFALQGPGCSKPG